MMDICPVAADHQSSKLDEFVMVFRRIRKAGRNARASSPTVGKSPTTANGRKKPNNGQRFFCFCIARVARSSLQAHLPPFWGCDRQGRRNRELFTGVFGCFPRCFETLAARQGGASFPGQERWRWRTSRRSSSTVGFTNRATGSRDNDSRKQLRKLGHCAHPSGTFERRFFPSPQVSFFLCTCRSRKKLGGFGDRRYQANGKDWPLRRQGKSSESKELAKKEFEQFSDHPLTPLFDRTARHRDRCCPSWGGDNPRPIGIANRLQLGSRGGSSERLSIDNEGKRG